MKTLMSNRCSCASTVLPEEIYGYDLIDITTIGSSFSTHVDKRTGKIYHSKQYSATLKTQDSSQLKTTEAGDATLGEMVTRE